MSLYLAARDGGQTDEKGIYQHLSGLFKGEVINGLEVVQQDPVALGITVTQGRCFIPSGDDYPYIGFTDSDENVALATADGSNPRIDAIVAYVDLTVVDDSNPNNPGAFVIDNVSGTPAGSPVAPNAAAIESVIGGTNPYIILAYVQVNAGATTVTDGNITDQRVSVSLKDDLSGVGWIAPNETWTFSSFSSAIGVITVPTDATIKYSVGMRIRISQSTGGTKYGIITKVEATALTVYFGTDYTLNNETIFNPYYSTQKAPFGFPIDPAKWTVTITASNDRSTTSGSYTSLTDTFAAPIGAWRMLFRVGADIPTTTTISLTGFISLTSSGTTETNPNLTVIIRHRSASGASTSDSGGTFFAEDFIAVSSATTFTLMGKTGGAGTLTIYGSTFQPTVVRFVCAYL